MGVEVYRLIEVIIASIGLILVVFGWIIPYRQDRNKLKLQNEQELDMEKIKWRKEQIDRQISQLYGPIYALIIEGDVLFARILYQLGRRYVIGKDISFNDLPEDEKSIWSHYVDNYKIPTQLKMAEILRANIHLIYNSEVPTCYRQFLDYSLGWELLDNQKRNGVPNFYEYHYSYNYPQEFNYYIKNTLETLLGEQAKLIELTVSKSESTIMKKSARKLKVEIAKRDFTYESDDFVERYITVLSTNETEDSQYMDFPRLKSLYTGEIIVINKPLFYIGRDGETSDLFIKNNRVNYKHAFIISKESQCFIKDNNSINGTYVNDKKVYPYTECLLSNNSIIKIANEEFVFVEKFVEFKFLES